MAPTTSAAQTATLATPAKTHAQEIAELKSKLDSIAKTVGDMASSIGPRITQLEKKVG